MNIPLLTTLNSVIQHSWNAFRKRDPTDEYKEKYYPSSTGVYSAFAPYKRRFTAVGERTIVNTIYNRIAVDTADIRIMHAQLDKNNMYSATIDSRLNRCLTYSANIDQTGRQLIQDIVMSMFDEGVVAVVPVDTDIDPENTEAYDILSLRTAEIVEWFPEDVKVRLYDEQDGDKKEIILPKKIVAIIENPFYSIMNEPNSTARRLMNKLLLLDTIDDRLDKDKLDIIIQLPYLVKSPAKKKIADQRRQDLEDQLNGSKLGVGYIDATEKVIQLNRPLENNLLEQVEYLQNTLISQLNLSPAIFDGTATEEQMLNYYNRTIVPILSAITEEMSRKFLSKTARTQGRSIIFMNNPFKLATVNKISEMADKFTRNEILSSNELRAIIGYKPIDDERANELRNKNLNQEAEAPEPMLVDNEEAGEGEEDEFDRLADEILNS